MLLKYSNSFDDRSYMGHERDRGAALNARFWPEPPEEGSDQGKSEQN